MRRFSTISALAAGALALLLGVYVTQATHSGSIPVQKQAGFTPNTLLIDSNLKNESWEAF